jgi:hypothetical protein
VSIRPVHQSVRPSPIFLAIVAITAVGGVVAWLAAADIKPLAYVGVFTFVIAGWIVSLCLHEFGHAFGLPDLYDTDGGSAGVGEWCLMGSGNWNTPTNPAHMSAWSKSFLGWTNVIVAPATPTPFNILDVETHRDVYRLDIMKEKWRRMTDCALTGAYSLRCGLTEDEAYTRWWDGGSGYGNFWDTTVSRDFHYSGSGTVTPSLAGYEFTPSQRTYDNANAAWDQVIRGVTTVENVVTQRRAEVDTNSVDQVVRDLNQHGYQYRVVPLPELVK